MSTQGNKYKKVSILGLSVLFSSVFFMLSTCGQAKSKAVFLDINGNPITLETLNALSAGRGKSQHEISIKNKISANKISVNKKSVNKKTHLTKRQPNSTPEKEQELLGALLVGNTPRAKQLIKSGVKVNYKNSKGETPLSVSVRKAWASMVLELLEHGGDIYQKGPKGITLLHLASSRGYTDIAKLLIKHGLNPATRTDKNWNSLHIAARYGHWQLVRLYLEMGVDPNARNSDGKTALELARQTNQQGVAAILSRVTTARAYDHLLFKKSNKSNKRKRRKKRNRH